MLVFCYFYTLHLNCQTLQNLGYQILDVCEVSDTPYSTGKLVVDMCSCLQTSISAVVMAVVIGQSLIVLPFIMYYAPPERTREIILRVR